MKQKLNPVIYNKLLLQAQEAKAQGMTKLAENISESIGDEPAENFSIYSYASLNDDIHQDLWKLATRIIYYNNLESVNVEKLDKTILALGYKLLEELEKSLKTDSILKSDLEPKVPGEE